MITETCLLRDSGGRFGPLKALYGEPLKALYGEPLKALPWC